MSPETAALFSAALPPILFQDDFIERHRVAWRVEPGEPDPANPLLTPEQPWEDTACAVGHGTILRDPIDGKFKGWTPVMSSESPEHVGECEFRLAYIESEDGVCWRRPQLDLCPWPGHPHTNLIFDNDSGGRTTFASVFVEPERRPDEPYEMFCFREVHWRCPARCVAGFGQTPARDDWDVWKYYGLYRYRSRDGIHWRGVEGPLNLQTADACYLYREPGGGYVAHHKSAIPLYPGGAAPYECYDQCRVNKIRYSDDGSNWSQDALLMAPDWRDRQGDQIMEVARHPYGPGYVATVTVYHAVSQQIDVQFAASADGRNYWRPIPRNPCIANGPLGDYGGGMIWPFRCPLVQDGRLYAYYGALAGLHGDLYAKTPDMRLFRDGALCRCSWPLGRFFAVVNADGGGRNADTGGLPGSPIKPDGSPYSYVTTPAAVVAGKQLYLNARSCRGGELTVALLDERRRPIPGFTQADCRAFSGDEMFRPVAWRGQPALPSQPVHTRIYLTTGMLYGFAWQ